MSGRVRGSARRAAAGFVVAAAALASAACGTADGATTSVADPGGTLTIGVKGDQPGLGERAANGTYSGFDVDVAKYIAGKLGYRPDQIEFTTVKSADRERDLRDGTVDMILASYSITPERKREVLFGGPYYVAHQDILVRSADTSIQSVDDLAGKKVCRVAGSDSWDRIAGLGIKAEPVDAPNYGGCVRMLLDGTIEAVSTDDLILAGYGTRYNTAAQPRVRVVNAPFSDEWYGVGLRKGDIAGCEKVNSAITSMYQDATAQIALAGWFGTSGLKAVTDNSQVPAVPQFEGCS